MVLPGAAADFRKQLGAVVQLDGLLRADRRRNRIRIDEYEPITGSNRSSAISRPANLVDRLEQNAGSRRPRQFSGVVGRIIVTNDQFTVPSQLMKCRSSRFDALQRRTDQFFLVKGRNNNRDFHEAK